MKHREITGSLAERNDRYTAILNLYDEDGKRRQKSIALGIPVKGNKRKAQAQLEELKRAYNLGLPQEGKTWQESPLFADFLRDWLEITAPTIERTTYQSYRGLIAARLDPFFRARGLRLRELEPKHIRELHRSIFADGCGANTVIHYHAVVRKALQYAVKMVWWMGMWLTRWTGPRRASIWRDSTQGRNLPPCSRPRRTTPSRW